MAKNPPYLPTWARTVGGLKDEAASCKVTCGCGARDADLDAIIEKFGRDYSLVDRNPLCPTCKKRVAFLFSGGKGSPMLPLRANREREIDQEKAERARAGLAAPDTITTYDALELGWEVTAECAGCQKVIHPDVRAMLSTAWTKQPLAQLFRMEKLTCVCGLPFAGLTVSGAASPGGVREPIRTWFQAGSPADPQVRKFWAKTRKALGQR